MHFWLSLLARGRPYTPSLCCFFPAGSFLLLSVFFLSRPHFAAIRRASPFLVVTRPSATSLWATRRSAGSTPSSAGTMASATRARLRPPPAPRSTGSSSATGSSGRSPSATRSCAARAPESTCSSWTPTAASPPRPRPPGRAAGGARAGALSRDRYGAAPRRRRASGGSMRRWVRPGRWGRLGGGGRGGLPEGATRPVARPAPWAAEAGWAGGAPAGAAASAAAHLAAPSTPVLHLPAGAATVGSLPTAGGRRWAGATPSAAAATHGRRL